MAAKIRHVAIVSHQSPVLSRFYQTLFGMTSGMERAEREGGYVTDGYIGMNFPPRYNGRQGSFDHFGIEVDDLEEVEARVRERYPRVRLLKRPSSRPFAGHSMHDPAGNVFDLAHLAPEDRKGFYVTMGMDDQQHPRHIDHFMLRTVDARGIAKFYTDVFGFAEGEKAADDPNFYVTDGKVTMIIAPWNIEDYAGSGIERPALDHLGFKVESLAAFKADLDRMIENDPRLTPQSFDMKPAEGAIRLALLKTCGHGDFQLADPDGVLLEVGESTGSA